MDRTWISLEAAARILGRHPRTTLLILDGQGARHMSASGVKRTWHVDDVKAIARDGSLRRAAHASEVDR